MGSADVRSFELLLLLHRSRDEFGFPSYAQANYSYVATDAASAHGYGTRRRGAMKPGFFKVQDEWDTEGKSMIGH